jgi:ECF sigma factor
VVLFFTYKWGKAVPEGSVGEVTTLLLQIRAGDSQAADKLVPLAVDELRRLARLHLRALGSKPRNQNIGVQKPRANAPSMRPILRHQGIYLRHAFVNRQLGISFRYPAAECVETIAIATDTGNQFGIDQSRHRFAIFTDHNAVVAVLDPTEHLTQILAKRNRIYL